METAYPNNCTNKDCPYWSKFAEEHCDAPTGVANDEEWIAKWCDNQEADDEA